MKNGLRDQKDRAASKIRPAQSSFASPRFISFRSLLDDNFGFIKSKVNPLQELEINLNFSIILARGAAQGEAIIFAAFCCFYAIFSIRKGAPPFNHTL